MSESSESIYIRSGDRQHGVTWLRAVGLQGYVLEPRGDWLQVFADWSSVTSASEKRAHLAKVEALVIHYRFDADSHWAFEVYADGELKAEYQCLWDDDQQVLNGLDVEELSQLLGIATSDLHRLLAIDDGEHSWEELMDNAAEFADAVGLPNYAWASFEYIDMDAGVTGMDEFFVDLDADDADAVDESPQADSKKAPTPPGDVAETMSEKARQPGTDAPWQAVYDLASYFLKHLHDEELIELTLDSRLARDRLVETLTKTIIDNPVSSDSQIVHHWLENLMTAPEIVDIFATDDMLIDAYERAKADVQASS